MDAGDPEAGLAEVNSEPKAHDRVRVVVVGDSGVGKSAFIHVLCRGSVLRHAVGTVGCELDVALHAYAGIPYFVELLEVGGADKFRSARGVFFAQPFDGAILMHDLTNRNSLHNLERWRHEIRVACLAAGGHADGDHPNMQRPHPASNAGAAGSGGPQRPNAPLERSPSGSLNRRQLSTGVPHAEEDWMETGETARVPCITLGSKLDLAARSGTGPPGGLEASMTTPTIPRAALGAFFSRVIENSRAVAGDHYHPVPRRSLFS
mmetsp:Transcript_10131/g.26286  ORF Transcript_10131/g.26286 Transcript_10131/m.26286 type:complete len:263 (-) Transcript_10131:177-965(-)